ncbi:MAG: hypothetical protein ACREH9_00060 [Pseudomonadota bacterium]
MDDFHEEKPRYNTAFRVVESLSREPARIYLSAAECRPAAGMIVADRTIASDSGIKPAATHRPTGQIIPDERRIRPLRLC